MPYGQQGWTTDTGGGGNGGSFWDFLPDWGDVVDIGRDIFGPQPPMQGPRNRPRPRQGPMQPLPYGPPGPVLTSPPPSGVDALTGVIEWMAGEGGSANGGGLFKPPTASMKVRPVNEITRMSPDGRCYTWGLLTPTHWSVNKRNVRGRRKHHHHPR